MAIRIIRNVPADEVDAVEQMFRDSGATAVSRAREPDGEFTVTAVFPDIERHDELAARLAQNAAPPGPPPPPAPEPAPDTPPEGAG